MLDVAHALVKMVNDTEIYNILDMTRLKFLQPALVSCITEWMWAKVDVTLEEQAELMDEESILVVLLSYRALKIYVFDRMDKKLKKLEN